ncbi:MAG TPA: hypothetical protein VFV80_08780 [Geminicoccaceae bacterium]|nr:hypothetical protein [Geminicoccaceae bacterium]
MAPVPPGFPRIAQHGAADAAAVPADCPYSFDQIVGQDWYPRNRYGRTD